MDLAWNDPRTRQFVTNVGLVTSDGPIGPNIMAAEWTHHVSYAPSLIAVCISASGATAESIQTSREFGVSLAAESQRILCSVAGGSTGREVNKIAALTELGAVFYAASRINAPMLAGAALNAECTVREILALGDRLTIVGEVLELSADTGVRPLAYHKGQYWTLGEALSKPAKPDLDRIKAIVASHRRVDPTQVQR